MPIGECIHHIWDRSGRIRIRINPGIRIRIPDRFLALVEIALSECSLLRFCSSDLDFAVILLIQKQRYNETKKERNTADQK